MAAESPDSFSTVIVPSSRNVVVMLRGELDLYAAPMLTRTLEEFVGGGFERIVLDLSELTFMDSQGLSVLVLMEQRLRERGQGFALRSPRPAQQKVLEIVGLTEQLNVEAPPPAQAEVVANRER